jgi:hypothetical protein
VELTFGNLLQRVIDHYRIATARTWRSASNSVIRMCWSSGNIDDAAPYRPA